MNRAMRAKRNNIHRRANRRIDWVSTLLVLAALILGITVKHWL